MPTTVSHTAPLEVVMPGADQPLQIVPPSLPNGVYGQPFAVQFKARGGVLPYRWSVIGVPVGFTISGDGVLAGTPMSPGTFNVTVSVTDSSD